MESVAEISAEAVPAIDNNLLANIINVMTVICGLGFVVFVCVATSGGDSSASFF